jgi:hypothetical protein
MNQREDLEVFLKLAKAILLRWRAGEQVSREEIDALMPIVFWHRDDEDEAMKKMFVLAMEIEEHYRGLPDGNKRNIEGLANSLNELTYLANQP